METRIQELTHVGSWHHVLSKENPADLLSRGAYPDQIKGNTIWWCGPTWLLKESADWPTERPQQLRGELPERKTVERLSALATTSNAFNLFERYSSFSKLRRITAWILRFYHNLRNHTERVFDEYLSPRELEEATYLMIKVIQSNEFSQELESLRKKAHVAINSSIKNLNPFIDKNGLLRVGGRLKHANLYYDATFPVLLPKKHNFTSLLIMNEHVRLNHAGVMVVLNTLRQKYWPIHGRSAVKKLINKCMCCFEAKPSAFNPPMGNLPGDRVTPARAFETCSVDYAGPIFIKDGKLRNRNLVKSYLCIFICFSTKAIHIELAGDMTAQSFLNCLHRFISRRDLCRHIYSDNGSNFIGARNELAELGSLLTESNTVHEIKKSLNNKLIEWTFIPPHAQHFGGLWERAVKSVKYQLKIMIGRANLTFEEISTVLTEVEAWLNSRPICPLSNDPRDMRASTPGHFLIGQPLKALPDWDVTEIKEGRLDRFQRLQQLYQTFWKRWSFEYLNQLQVRAKGTKEGLKLKPNMMVLVKEDNLPPLQWSLGRIQAVHLASDGIVRVATILTNKGKIKRPAVKLCPLPMEGS
ncbi:uncharacterized protein [Prorops nasuta]|uniref:uncharacterized protein n=1 Tax=Prorops nasuta TaxID=863751 RepID=UPI0034CDFFA2